MSSEQPAQTIPAALTHCLKKTHISWHPVLAQALAQLDGAYLQHLSHDQHWLPGLDRCLNAFSIPSQQVRYVLLGESPYPRAQSANGYAFWDQAVDKLWSPSGAATSVNKATSLRNLMKTLLLSQDLLSADDLSQQAIARLDKSNLVQSIEQLFHNFLASGFLLLNASLALSPHLSVTKEARHWHPFLTTVLHHLHQINPHIKLILFGKIADRLTRWPQPPFQTLTAEHPYNQSFIHNQAVQDFFKDLSLMTRSQRDEP